MQKFLFSFWPTSLLKSFVTGFAAFGAAHTAGEGLSLHHPHLVQAKIFLGVVTCIGFQGYQIYNHYSILSSLSSFFGFSAQRSLYLVLSSYEHVVPFVPDKTDPKQRYSKLGFDGIRHFVIGAHDSVCGYSTVKSAFEAIESASRLPETTVHVLVDHLFFENNTQERSSGRTYVCFGSSGTNAVTAWLYAQQPLSNQQDLFHFEKPGLVSNRNTQKPVVLQADTKTDYAVLARLSNAGNTYFLCAGIDEEGTVCAVKNLFNNWRTLNKTIKGRDFFQVWTVDKGSMTLSQYSRTFVL
jgi:hypothetical protein